MDWEGFLRRVFQRLGRDIDPRSKATQQALTRALQEAQKVAIQASFETQLLLSGVLCVQSYLPPSWRECSRLRVAIALLDEAGCRVFQDQYKRAEENDWCITANILTETIDLRDSRYRYRTNLELHAHIEAYINRLQKHRFLVEGEECAVYAKVSFGDHRAYTTFAAKNRNINFQTLPGAKRSEVQALARTPTSAQPQPLVLEDMDISASQLKIALALRGHYYPIEYDAWSSVAQRTPHPARASVDSAQWRDFIKTVSLSIVLGYKNISIRDAWKRATGKSPKAGVTEGVKSAITSALFAEYPQLENPLTPRTETPDKVQILGHKSDHGASVRGHIHHQDGHLVRINTTYNIKTTGTMPDVWSTLIAHEAWLMREVIFAMPDDLPILPVHDQLYFPAGYKIAVIERANSLLKSLASSNAPMVMGH